MVLLWSVSCGELYLSPKFPVGTLHPGLEFLVLSSIVYSQIINFLSMLQPAMETLAGRFDHGILGLVEISELDASPFVN